jgi:hypothetical protein
MILLDYIRCCEELCKKDGSHFICRICEDTLDGYTGSFLWNTKNGGKKVILKENFLVDETPIINSGQYGKTINLFSDYYLVDFNGIKCKVHKNDLEFVNDP